MSSDPSPGPAEQNPASEPRQRRTYLRAEERRRLIIEAAQRVFAQTNLQGARTRDIAREADVNEATLFQHFPSKEALFRAAVIEPLLETMHGMDERAQIYQQAGSSAEMEQLSRDSTAEHLKSIVTIFPLLLAALSSDAEMGRKIYNEEIAPLMRSRGEAMRGLIKDGLDPDIVALAMFGALFAVAMDQRFSRAPGDIDHMAEQVGKMLISGFRKDFKPSVE